MIRKFLAIILTLLLSACTYGMSGDDLLVLPRQTLELEAISRQIDKLIDENDATLIAPIAGANRQTIQKRDLTGDGTENALIFYHAPSEEPIHIAIFSRIGNEFELKLTIELPGETLTSIAYADLTGEGTLDIIVGTQIGEESPLKTLFVFRLDDTGAHNILQVDYDAVVLHDINGLGRKQLMTLHYDNYDAQGYVLLYEWTGFEMSALQPVLLSDEITGLQHIRFSDLLDGTPAIFITSIASTNNEENSTPAYDIPMVKTDVIIYRDGALINISDESTPRQAFLSIVDINSDGILDIPSELSLHNADESIDMTGFNLLLWQNYNAEGELVPLQQTLHSFNVGWFFVLPESWHDSLVISRQHIGARERQIVLGVTDADGTLHEVLSVSLLVGVARGQLGDGMFEILARNDDVIAAEVFELDEHMIEFEIDEAMVRNSLYWVVLDMLPDDLHD